MLASSRPFKQTHLCSKRHIYARLLPPQAFPPSFGIRHTHEPSHLAGGLFLLSCFLLFAYAPMQSVQGIESLDGSLFRCSSVPRLPFETSPVRWFVDHVSGFGFRVSGFGFWVWGLRFARSVDNVFAMCHACTASLPLDGSAQVYYSSGLACLLLLSLGSGLRGCLLPPLPLNPKPCA
jgi:hypothetical protein